MIFELVGVLQDASKPAGSIKQKVPFRQDIELPRLEDLTIKLQVLRQNHEPVDLTAMGSIKLGVRQFTTDAEALLTKSATATVAGEGRAEIQILAADTADVTKFFDRVPYVYDVQFMDSTAKRWQIVPISIFRLLPVVNLAGD